jgi:hypothetical protein
MFPPWKKDTSVVQAGEPVVIELVKTAATTQEATEFNAGRWVLYVVGRIEYKDVFGNVHERGYVFALDAEAKTFYAPPDTSGYDYET